MERWRPIPGYEGRYEASDQGRVRSVDRQVRTVSRCGAVGVRTLRGQIIAPQEHSQGYRCLRLGGASKLVHALVLLAFVGPRPDGMQGAHGDGNRTNNKLTNLRYATPLENHDDRRKHGTSGAGQANANSRTSRERRAVCSG